MSLQVEVTSRRSLCPAEGHFPYDADCQRFFKCRVELGRLHGTMYQCPQGYTFWDVSRRCERSAKVPPCTRGTLRLWRPTGAPIETNEIGNR